MCQSTKQHQYKLKEKYEVDSKIYWYLLEVRALLLSRSSAVVVVVIMPDCRRRRDVTCCCFARLVHVHN